MLIAIALLSLSYIPVGITAVQAFKQPIVHASLKPSLIYRITVSGRLTVTGHTKVAENFDLTSKEGSLHNRARCIFKWHCSSQERRDIQPGRKITDKIIIIIINHKEGTISVRHTSDK